MEIFAPGICQPFMGRLQRLFGLMDRKYAETAAGYGFHCKGCEESCCRTRFHHHTLIEYLYLHTGLRSLDPDLQKRLRLRAQAVCRPTAAADRLCRGRYLRRSWAH